MLYFTEDQIAIMKSIFLRLDTSTLTSLQYRTKETEFSTGRTIAIYNKWKKPICIYQNFKTLSPWRMKLLKRLAVKIPFTLYITYPSDDIVRVGWKWEAKTT